MSYFIYIEQARVEFLLDNEIIPKVENWPFVLVSTHCDYKQQIYVNDRIVVKTFLKEIGRSSFTLGYEIVYQDKDELLAYGESVVVNYDFGLKKSIPVSVEMRNKMEEFLIKR